MAMWVCPHCWGENLNYGGVELEWEGCYFPWVCEDCGIRWEEWYGMEYEWQYNLLDKDWNDLILNQKENDSEGVNK